MTKLLYLLFALAFVPSIAFAQTIEDAIDAHKAGDYETAKAIAAPLAEAGDPKALNLIGLMYDFGDAYPKDANRACDYYERSAKAGFAAGLSNLAFCYRFGDGRPKDVVRACDLNEQAAKKGDIAGQANLAICYQYGRGRPEDMEQSIYWTVKAAEQGDLRSQTFLVTYFDNHGHRDLAEKWALESVKSDSVYARVIAWSQQVEHEGKQATMSEIACVFFNSFLLRKGWDYCD